MACKECEERRRKLKAIANDSANSIANAIAWLAGRDRKTEQSDHSAEQSIDKPAGDTDQSEQRIVVNARRSRTKRTT